MNNLNIKTKIRAVLQALKKIATVINYDRLQKYYLLFLAILVIQLAILVYPFVFSKIPVKSEFSYLPQQTLLQADGNKLWVDNTNYINSESLYGIHYKYDPRVDSGTNRQYPGTALKTPLTPELKEFVDNSYFKYYYDVPSGSLVAVEPVNDADCAALKKLLPVSAWNAVDKYAERTRNLMDNLIKQKYSADTYDFISLNMDEWAWQTRGQGIIHHRSFIFTPIRELEYGKSPADIYFQYGYGMAQLLRWLMKITGGITFSNFVHVVYLFYLLYFILYVLTVRLILKRWDLVLAAAAMSVYGIEYLYFTMFYAYDGLNPIRYFFDVFVIAAFYQYCETGKSKYYWLAAGFAGIMTVHNAHYGLFLYIALLCAGLYQLVASQPGQPKGLVKIVLTVLLGAVCYKIGTPGPDIMGKYIMAGMLSVQSSSRVLYYLFVFGFVYLFLLWRKISVERKTFAVFLLLYCQQMLLFEVLEGVYETVVPIVALTLMYFIAQFFETGRLRCIRTAAFFLIVSYTLAVFAYPAAIEHFRTRNQYYADMNNHKLYEWPFHELDIVSDADPQLVIESSALLNKYFKERQIAVLSQYDILLLPAAGKVNFLPYCDQRSFLFARSEFDQALQQLQNRKPEYIAVDTEITASPALSVIRYARMQNILRKANNFEVLQTVGRAESTKRLASLWEKIAENYALVEKGRLISIYKRKVNDGQTKLH